MSVFLGKIMLNNSTTGYLCNSTLNSGAHDITRIPLTATDRFSGIKGVIARDIVEYKKFNVRIFTEY